MPYEVFLKILKYALNDKEFTEKDALSHSQWIQVLRLAHMHRVLPLVYDTAYKAFTCEKQEMEFLRQSSRMLVVQQASQTERFLKLYKMLCEKGLEPIVVKGIVCRALYPKPDLRLSSDEDLLITGEEYPRYVKALSQEGYFIADNNAEDSYEISFVSGEGLHIELHKALFDEEREFFSLWNSFFSDAHKRAICIEVENVKIKTLSCTDHLLFLILHGMKHFIHSGIGIRQICDIVMFANRFGGDIDWKYIYDKCTLARAVKFVAAVFIIGEKYLNFDKEKACFPQFFSRIKVNEELLLSDIMGAGIYGSADTARLHSSGFTLDAATGNRHSMLRRLFPSSKALSGRYSYVRKRPYLLPVAWSQRLIKYSKEVSRKEGNTPAESIKVARQRIKIMAYYDIID